MQSLQAAAAREVHRERLAVAERHRLVRQARAERRSRRKRVALHMGGRKPSLRRVTVLGR